MWRSRCRAVAGTIAAASVVVVLGAQGVATQPTAVQAPIPGLANVAGTVQSSSPFTAARVYLRNVDKHILYMVYTAAGR